jgi:hypothetical protein
MVLVTFSRRASDAHAHLIAYGSKMDLQLDKSASVDGERFDILPLVS